MLSRLCAFILLCPLCHAFEHVASLLHYCVTVQLFNCLTVQLFNCVTVNSNTEHHTHRHNPIIAQATSWRCLSDKGWL